MRRLNIQDAAFLTVETDECPTHVAGLQIFQLPKRYKGNFFEEMFARFDLSLPPAPPFNLKLAGNVLLNPHWVEDEHFDLDYHVRFVRLPAPGTMEQLTRLVSRLHGQVLDRHHPLWECYYIEGIEGNRVAQYVKIHHSLVDGMAAMAITGQTMSHKRTHKLDKGFWQIDCGYAASDPQPAANSLASFATVAVAGAASTARSARELALAFARAGFFLLSGEKRDAPLPFASPATPFNSQITRHRRLGVETLSLSRLKDLGKNLDATVNDIVLAICAGALRTYLQAKHALPKEPLTTMCPVSVRPKDAEQAGNQISMIVTTLATDIADPLARLEAIKKSARSAKEHVGSFSRETATNYALLLNGAVLATNSVGLAGTIPPPANLVISNVPGPRTPLYLNGAELVANYPLSVLVHSQALNITVTSYMDSIDFGLLADREAVPDVETMAEMIRMAADELEEAFEKKMEVLAFQAAQALDARRRLKEAQDEAGKKKPKAKKKAAKKKAKKAAAKKPVVTPPDMEPQAQPETDAPEEKIPAPLRAAE